MHAEGVGRLVLVLLTGLLTCQGCRKGGQEKGVFSREDSLRVSRETIAHRASVDSFFRYDPASPFLGDSTTRFTGIKWFPADLRYYFRSTLHRHARPDTVIVYGTKGEPRQKLRYGYFLISFGGGEYRLHVYRSVPKNPLERTRYGKELSVWFTDETTGKETYHVGRYVDVGQEQPSADALYTINLNNAYNPYCAYSPRYSCAIPRKEDHLPFRVTAGEMKYHD